MVTRPRGLDDCGCCVQLIAVHGIFFRKEKGLHRALLHCSFHEMCDDFERSVNEGRTRDVIAALARVGKDGSREDPTADNNKALICAALKGHVEVVRELLEWVGVDGKRVDPTARNNDAVRLAALNGCVGVVQVLLAWVGVDGQRVDPTAGNNYAVRWAASNGHVEVVRLLLKWVGVDGKRVDIEVTRRATKSLAVLAVCDEAASIAAWWSPARVAWMIGVVASN